MSGVHLLSLKRTVHEVTERLFGSLEEMQYRVHLFHYRQIHAEFPSQRDCGVTGLHTLGDHRHGPYDVRQTASLS
jgi:hypothetical protein